MPHQSFGTVRQAAHLEPITFDFGVFAEETFTVVPDPSLGDTFDLYDAPEPNPTNMIESTRVLSNFIRRLLPIEDRARFDKALYRIPMTHSHLIYECAVYITENITPFVPPLAESSSDGRPPVGSDSKSQLVGVQD